MMPNDTHDQTTLLRVLVADNAPLVTESLTALLSALEGLSVFACSQEPCKVLALVERLRPDVVILDLQVPGQAGFQLLSLLLGAQCAPAVIVLSHYIYPPFREKCLQAGADYFFQKTTELPQLSEALRTITLQKNSREK